MIKAKRKAPEPITLKVVTSPLENLSEHPKNSRYHDETNLRAIMASLSKFGQRTPIVANPQGQIVKGNGTFQAMTRLGWTEASVAFHQFSSEAEEIAYMVADNKTGDLSEFNFQFLTENLQELKDAGFDLASTGFAEFEIEPLLSSQDWEPEAENDNTPGAQKTFEGSGIKKDTIVFSTVMRKAAARFRKRNHKPDISLAEALEQLCVMYVRKSLK